MEAANCPKCGHVMKRAGGYRVVKDLLDAWDKKSGDVPVIAGTWQACPNRPACDQPPIFVANPDAKVQKLPMPE
jgi:hypothetical protein